MNSEISRRDDLESLGYSLVSLKDPLPWSNMPSDEGSSKKKQKIILKRAMSRVKDLCKGLPGKYIMLCAHSRRYLINCTVPGAFERFFLYVKALGFYDMPDYAYLLKLFTDAKHK